MAKFYLVGGSVRDKILNQPSADLDYAVEASSFEEMKQAILANQGTIFLESPAYFTIRAKMNGISGADFVLCRKESKYSDGRHPDNVEVGLLYDDLSRRDFTMNAIAMNENGDYIDPFGGIEDINCKQIRCVGHANERFNEDSLRLLRAIRFSITKGFSLHWEIWECLHDKNMVNKLSSVSPERIMEELKKAFKFDTFKTLKMLENYWLVKEFVFKNCKLWLKPTFES